ncbi:MAG: TIGR01458 family HAD-type hydrolase [Dehalococcoidia bacterium]|nr:TIGR01458 family HAD-type hydrolase [Dehalococcoidia bacterium]
MPIRGVLVDVEGTLYWKGASIPGAAATLAELQTLELPFRLLTNSDSKTRSILSTDLNRMGLSVKESHIYTATDSVLRFLSDRDDNCCYCIAPSSLMEIFAPFCRNTNKVDYVVVGDPREQFTYAVANTAFRYLMAGAELIALQKGKYFVREEGQYIDSGGFVTMLEYASGKEARVLGKPSKEFFTAALADFNCSPSEVLVVGDDLSTDIQVGKDIGARTVLVRTGKGSTASLSHNAADFEIASIAALSELIRQIDHQ